MDTNPLKNQIPYKIVNTGYGLQCRWLNTFGEPYTEPFFDETISKYIRLNSGNAYWPVSDLEMINEWQGLMNDNVKPAFIFHVSRCGSTLVSQLLAATLKHTVLSEVPFFDQVLRLPLQNDAITEQMSGELFTAVVKFYSQRPYGGDNDERQVFIKADSWHLFFYEQLRRLYPSTPFIAIYRRPNEVFRSQKKQPGMHAVRGLIEPELFGFDPGGACFETEDSYLTAVLESYLKKCLEIAGADDNFLLLNYNEGPMEMIKKIAAATRLKLTDQDLELMEERSRYHSKKPGERFSEAAVTGFPASLNNAMELYQMLEEKRIAGR